MAAMYAHDLVHLFEEYKDNPASEELQKIIFNTFKTSIFGFLTRKTRNYHDAEDILQDVFTRFFRLRGEQLKTSAPLRTVIFRIAYQCFVDHYRKTSKRLDNTPLTPSNDRPMSGAADEDFLSNALAMEILDRLPFNMSQVLQLRFLRNMSRTAVADLLQMTEHQVRYMEQSAKKRAKLVAKRYGWTLPVTTLFMLAQSDYASADISPLLRRFLVHQFAVAERALLTGELSKVVVCILMAITLFKPITVVVPATVIVGLSLFALRSCEITPQKMKPPVVASEPPQRQVTVPPAIPVSEPSSNSQALDELSEKNEDIPSVTTVPAAPLPSTLHVIDAKSSFDLVVTVRPSTVAQFLTVGNEVILDSNCVGELFIGAVNLVWTFPERTQRIGHDAPWTPKEPGTAIINLVLGDASGDNVEVIIALSVAPNGKDAQPLLLSPSMLITGPYKSEVEPLRIGDSQMILAGIAGSTGIPRWTGLEKGNVSLNGPWCAIVKPRSRGWHRVGFEIPGVATPVQVRLYSHDAEELDALEIVGSYSGAVFPLGSSITFKVPFAEIPKASYQWNFFGEGSWETGHRGGDTLEKTFDRPGRWTIEASMTGAEGSPIIGKGPSYSADISILEEAE